jgi:hypothetical protein
MNNDLSFREKRQKELEARRKERTGEYGPSYRLTVPSNVQEYLDQHGLVGRWVNDDDKGRIYDKTERDTWDFLTTKEVTPDPRNINGERIARRVGTKEDGTALFTYLCVKPKKWHDEDARRRARPHEEMMAEIRNRPLKTAADSDLSDDEEHAYIPREVKSRARGIKRAQNFDNEV